MSGKHVGFVTLRTAGTDGVSLETMKWATVLEQCGMKCHFIGGEMDTPPDRTIAVEEFHFKHPAIAKIYKASFDTVHRTMEITDEIHHYRQILKKHLYKFVKEFNIDLLIPENTLTIPLNLPLGMAITELQSELCINTIAHHHDFYWERKRFLTNSVWDILRACYPPSLGNISHVVINSSGRHQLALRTGIAATLIPNVMDFEHPPPAPDSYTADLRQTLGVADDELLVLQPTRVVQRKGIEHAIELLARMDCKVKLLISHSSGDESYEYEARVKEFSQLMNVPTIFGSDIINEKRGTTSDGRKIYSLQDVYPYADMITYPSLFEGFGNAFLEAVYFKKPILVNNYSIYSYDIKPLGFDVIEMDNFISSKTVERTNQLLRDPDRVKQMVEKNYQLGLRYFSYHVLRNRLDYLLKSMWGYSSDN